MVQMISQQAVDSLIDHNIPIVKESILKWSRIPSNLRIVISTVAFGMANDCHDIAQVIHQKVLNHIFKRLVALVRLLAVLILVKGVVIHHAELATKHQLKLH